MPGTNGMRRCGETAVDLAHSHLLRGGGAAAEWKPVLLAHRHQTLGGSFLTAARVAMTKTTKLVRALAVLEAMTVIVASTAVAMRLSVMRSEAARTAD
jgi:hypothetical protein